MISEFPLWLFTILTGLAEGAYIAAAIFPRKNQGTDDESKGKRLAPWVFPLVSLILIGVGSLCAVAHLGRPQLVLNVLNNPMASITMEGMTAGFLALIAIIDLVIGIAKGVANRPIRIIGAIMSVICMCVATSAYVTSYGNIAWIDPSTYPLFFLGALSGGFALWLSIFSDGSKPLAFVCGIIAVLFACNLFWEGGVFVSLDAAGSSIIFVGAVIALGEALVAFLMDRKLGATPTLRAAVVVIAIAAFAISRYGFYMASII